MQVAGTGRRVSAEHWVRATPKWGLRCNGGKAEPHAKHPARSHDGTRLCMQASHTHEP